MTSWFEQLDLGGLDLATIGEQISKSVEEVQRCCICSLVFI